MKSKITSLIFSQGECKKLPVAALVGTLAMSYPMPRAEESATPTA